MIEIKKSEIEECRNAWKKHARKHKWIKKWEKNNFSMAIWIDVRTKEIDDTLYLLSPNPEVFKNDIFRNRDGSKKVRVKVI